MGSQISSMSLSSQASEADTWESRTTATEKSELVNEKTGAGNPGQTVTEKPEEPKEKAHASEPSTDYCSIFFKLPRKIRNILYSYALDVEDGYTHGVSRGVICLADEPGYPPKLCSLAYMHTGYQRTEDYLTEDYKLLKPFISRKAEAWRIEINQLKYVCKQLHRETWSITLKINAGRKFMFHGTRISGSSGMTNLTFEDIGRISGMAKFVHFYRKCSPEQQEHIQRCFEISVPNLQTEVVNPWHCSLQ